MRHVHLRSICGTRLSFGAFSCLRINRSLNIGKTLQRMHSRIRRGRYIHIAYCSSPLERLFLPRSASQYGGIYSTSLVSSLVCSSRALFFIFFSNPTQANGYPFCKNDSWISNLLDPLLYFCTIIYARLPNSKVDVLPSYSPPPRKMYYVS
jgi:hypothetical protein